MNGIVIAAQGLEMVGLLVVAVSAMLEADSGTTYLRAERLGTVVRAVCAVLAVIGVGLAGFTFSVAAAGISIVPYVVVSVLARPWLLKIPAYAKANAPQANADEAEDEAEGGDGNVVWFSKTSAA